MADLSDPLAPLFGLTPEIKKKITDDYGFVQSRGKSSDAVFAMGAV